MIGTTLLDRYRLDAELGRGGMGVIYRAYDTLLDRAVAVKLVSDRDWGTEGRSRLLHEAQAAARLNHPNIVSIYDAGEAGGVPFIVMELIEGTSLYDRPPQTLDETIVIARQISDALEHAHAHGIVHRDLKPENVLIIAPPSPSKGEGQGVRVKLTDFGLARSAASRLTGDGTIIGTVYYMAPELALGQPFDGRADLYALGVMLYEMLTGRLPFIADDPIAIVSQHLYAPVVPPSTHRPDIPPALDALIVRLMSKAPDDRPASAAAVKEALSVESLYVSMINVPPSNLERLGRGRVVGREHELAEIDAHWRRAASGEGHVLLISGEPGIGKTRLVRELVARCRVTKSTALTGECFSQGGLPYAPIAQIIRDALEEKPGLPEQVGFSPVVLSDLLTLAPDLRVAYPDVAPNPPLDPQSEQQRLFESVVALCAALSARTPLLVCLDDAHWADSGTLFLLHHLARRARHMRLLIVLTYREIELDEAALVRNVLHDLNRERLAERIKLTRLDRRRTGEMLAGLLTPSGDIGTDLVDAIYRETEGNPFFVEEVCKALIEAGRLMFEQGRWLAPDVKNIDIPQSVRLTIQLRLARLPAPIQDVLRIAAVLGREFDFDTLRQAGDLDDDALLEALEIAERAQLIEEVRRGTQTVFAFAHVLIPATLRESVSGLRRQRLHRRVAAAIEAVRPDDFEALAVHYEHGGDTDRAWANFLKAGDRALGVFANREAEERYRAALEVEDLVGHAEAAHDRARLLSGLGEALVRQSRYEDAIQTWQQAIALYQARPDIDSAAQLYARSARAAWSGGDKARYLSLCRQALKTVAGQPDSPGVAALLRATASACYFNGLPGEARRYAEMALQMAERVGDVEVQADALTTLGILPGLKPEESRDILMRAVGLAEPNGLLAVAARAHNNLGLAMETRFGDLRAALDHFLQSQALARRMGVASDEFIYLINAMAMWLYLGDLNAVAATLPELKRLLEAARNVGPAALGLHLCEARLLFYRGEWTLSAQQLREAIAEARRQDNLEFVAEANTYLAAALSEQGEQDEADEALMEAVAISARYWRDSVRAFCLAGAMRARRGNLDEAHRLLEDAQRQAGEHPSIYNDLHLSLAWGRLFTAELRWTEAFASYEATVAIAARMAMRWHQARISWEWAEAYLARGVKEDAPRAIELLRRALSAFKELDCPRFVSMVEYRLWAAERQTR